MRRVGRALAESPAAERQRSVDLVGGYLIEAFVGSLAAPAVAGDLQQRERTQNVGAGENRGVVYRAVDMRLGGEVDDSAYIVAANGVGDKCRVADIAPDEDVVACRLYIAQIGRVAGVCQLVEVDSRAVGILADQMSYEVASDESGTARYEDVMLVHVGYGVSVCRAI